MLNVDDLRRNGLSDAGPSPADRVAEEILYQRVQAWLKDRFREAELLEPGAHVDSAVREAIGKVMQAYRREAAIAGTPGLDDLAGVEQRLADRVLGFGHLAPLLADPDNEAIQVIGGRVRIYRHGRWELVEHLAPDDAETLRLIRRLLAPGDRIDGSSPEVESTLPDGSRLTAVIPPETEQVTLTIRRYVVRHHRLADLGTLPSEAVALVEAYARGGASIVTAGPGGAGKTTQLRCIVAAGDPSRTICSIEDVRELALHQYHPAAIPLYAHRANIEGAGARTYRELMRTALRLRPDVLVVGECRGAEALDWLLAAATGHQCLGTLHSDSPRGALRQLGTFAQLATEGINARAIGEMIAEHFDLVIVCGSGPTVPGALHTFSRSLAWAKMVSSTGATCGYSTPRRATWSRRVCAHAAWSGRGPSTCRSQTRLGCRQILSRWSPAPRLARQRPLLRSTRRRLLSVPITCVLCLRPRHSSSAAKTNALVKSRPTCAAPAERIH